MRLSDLDYDLPPELIAQEPLDRRDEARLEVVFRKTGAIEHSRFYKLCRYLHPGDVLVLNDTRVFPARLLVRKESGGKVELLFIRPADDPPGAWLALMRAHRPCSARLPAAARRRLGAASGPLSAAGAGDRRIGRRPADGGLLAMVGALALPHYIKREVTAADSADYQTVYAAHTGAIAAPTAGLHFTPELLQQLAAAGVRTLFVTLHIGPGTFAPLRSHEVEAHSMEGEWYTIPQSTARGVGACPPDRLAGDRGGDQQRPRAGILRRDRRP